MSLAYGTPIPQTMDGLQMQVAARQADQGHYPDGYLLWRVEAVRYSTCHLDERGGENYGATDPRLELFALGVRDYTPCGARLVGGRWVDLRPDRKQWASRTPEEALRQFAERRRRQIHILKRQLERAERELSLTEVWSRPL